MGNYFRPEPKREYSANGMVPYGAGDIFCLDAQVDNDFCGNVTEQLLRDGFKFDGFDLVSHDGRVIAKFREV